MPRSKCFITMLRAALDPRPPQHRSWCDCTFKKHSFTAQNTFERALLASLRLFHEQFLLNCEASFMLCSLGPGRLSPSSTAAFSTNRCSAFSVQQIVRVDVRSITEEERQGFSSRSFRMPWSRGGCLFFPISRETVPLKPSAIY